MSEPNYEALGRYHALRQQREQALAEIHATSKLIQSIGSKAAHYRPPYPGTDDLATEATHLSAVLPRFRELLEQVNNQWAQMEDLRIQHNLKP